MIDLAAPLRKKIEALLFDQFCSNVDSIDFDGPLGAPSLFDPDSVSWRIFKNPVALYVGGIAAVILELAEPRIRAGVWDRTSFRSSPLRRIRRTGLAALATVYAPKEQACEMIARVRGIHQRIKGISEEGEPYSASDPELLTWVHATASYGFSEAYHCYVAPLSPAERDCFFREGSTSAELYGALNPPRSFDEFAALQEKFTDRLLPSSALMTFLEMMGRIQALPGPIAKFEPVLVRGAISLLPVRLRKRLGLPGQGDLVIFERRLIRFIGVWADRFLLRNHPAARACRRLGLPEDYLYPKKIGNEMLVSRPGAVTPFRGARALLPP